MNSDNFNGKSILVVGGGILGKSIVSKLIKLNIKKIGLVSRTMRKDDTAISSDRFTFYQVDLSSSCIDTALFNETWDVIVFTAGYWCGRNNYTKDFHANLDPLLYFIYNIKSHPKKFIFLSSSAVYRDIFLEDCILGQFPDNTYGSAKLYSENLLKEFCDKRNVQLVIFRPFHISSDSEVFNPGRSHVLTDFVYKRLNGTPLPILNDFPEVYIPFLWVDDCANVIIKSIFHYSKNNTFNLGPRYEHSLMDAISIIDSLIFGSDYPLLLPRASKYFMKSYKVFGEYDSTDLKSQINNIIKSQNTPR
jgi:nucleoside-diphosphate-sugar epimerase